MKYPLQISPFLLVAVTLSLIAGCAAPVKTINNVTYRNAAFEMGRIESDGLAVLTIWGGSNVELYSRPLSEGVHYYCDSLFTDMTLLSWRDAMNQFNDADLITDYNQAIIGYEKTSALDRRLLKRMSEVTGMRYFLFIRLTSPTEDERTHFVYNPRTNTFRTRHTHTKGIKVHGAIWDATAGDMVWSGEASSTVSKDEVQVLNKEIPALGKTTAKALVYAMVGLPANAR